MVKRADLDVVGGIERVPDMGGPEIECHRRGLELERAARLEHAGDGAIKAVVRRGVAKIVGVVIGQADHRDHFAGPHIHHDAAGADGLELFLGFFQLVAHHALHAHVNREPQRFAVMRETFFESAFDAGDAVAVDIDAAEHLGGDTAERIAAFFRRAGNRCRGCPAR